MRALVLLNGDLTYLPPRADFDCVFCCDGAYDAIGGYPVDYLVGDFDSVTRELPDFCEVARIRLSAEKDYTDGEYAAKLAAEKGADEIVFAGAAGGTRIDQILTNFALLPYCADRGVRASFAGGNYKAFLAEGEFEFAAEGARYISIAPLYGDAHIKVTKGLKYAVRDTKVLFDRSRTVSNVPTAERVFLDVDEGRVAVILVFGEGRESI